MKFPTTLSNSQRTSVTNASRLNHSPAVGSFALDRVVTKPLRSSISKERDDYRKFGSAVSDARRLGASTGERTLSPNAISACSLVLDKPAINNRIRNGAPTLSVRSPQSFDSPRSKSPRERLTPRSNDGGSPLSNKRLEIEFTKKSF